LDDATKPSVIHRAAETRQELTVHLNLVTAPLADNWNATRRFKPTYMAIQYIRHSHAPEQWDEFVTISGPLILKTGEPSQATVLRDSWMPDAKRPEWVSELVEKYRPTNILEHAE
jgi:hypothetical protein